MSTAVIGTAFIDVKGFPFGAYDPVGRNQGEVILGHGGVGRNVAENFANVGMPVNFVGMLDGSAFGKEIEQNLRDIGVGLGYSAVVPERGIGIWAAVFDENGNLAGSVSQMPDVGMFEDHLRVCGEKVVDAADAVVLEIDLNERISEAVIDMAERHGKPVYAIVGNLSVAAARPGLVRRTRCFICNSIEAAKFFGDERLTGFSPEQMRNYLPAAVEEAGIETMVVTMGEHGALYCEGGSIGECPAVPTEVVDTSGAGDAFFSGTIMGLIRGLPLSKAVVCGTKLASATIGWYKATCPPNKEFFQ